MLRIHLLSFFIFFSFVYSAQFKLPEDFPAITSTNLNSSETNYLFLSNRSNPPYYLIILDQTGDVAYFEKQNSPVFDYKVQKLNNLDVITYYRRSENRYYIMDNTYTIVDSVESLNYTTRLHEMLITPDNHFLLLTTDTLKNVDMSLVISGGNPNASVLDCIIQELDENKNVVFEWRFSDHFEFIDSIEDTTALQNDVVNPFHANSLDIFPNGDILVSARNLSAVIRINKSDSSVAWVLGGKKNDFAGEWFNDSPRDGFSRQHNATVLSNLNILLFDNGNDFSEPYSRAVEYEVFSDPTYSSAAKVWEFRNSPDYSTGFTGSAQRFTSGSTGIGWGATPGRSDFSPAYTEVDDAGNITFEINMELGAWSYRVLRFDWNGVAAKPSLWADQIKDELLQLNFAKFGDLNTDKFIIYSSETANATIPIDTTDTYSVAIANLQSNKTYFFRVRALSLTGNLSEYSNEISVTTDTIIRSEINSNLSLFTVPAGKSILFSLRSNLVLTENPLISVTQNGNPINFKLNQTSNYNYQGQINIDEAGQYEVQAIQNAYFNRSDTTNRMFEIGIVDPKKENIVYFDEANIQVSLEEKSFHSSTILLYKIENDYISITSNNNLLKVADLRLNTRKLSKDSLYYISAPVDNMNNKLDTEINFDSNSLKTRINSFGLFKIVAELNSIKIFPQQFYLKQNYPNPFNPITTIQYAIPKDSEVTLTIYNSTGQIIRRMNEGLQKAGENKFSTWNGTNDYGSAVASGIYFYQLNADKYSETKKMLLIK